MKVKNLSGIGFFKFFLKYNIHTFKYIDRSNFVLDIALEWLDQDS